MCQRDIGRDRSLFWVRVYDNKDQGYALAVSDVVYKVITVQFPGLNEMGPKGWTVTTNNNRHLWIPPVRVDYELIKLFISWAEEANSHIWLGKNKNIENFFKDAVDCCIAADWNFDFETRKRTLVGEAEYQIKYHYTKGILSNDDFNKQKEILLESLLECCKFLPVKRWTNIFVSTIPAVKDDQNKLSWEMAKFVRNEFGCPFLTATLKKQKPEMKKLPINEKVNMWKNIYTTDGVILSDPVKKKTVLIVDDLYQSGTSIWAYAEYLKFLGASKVFAIVSVKSLKDSDNQ